MEAFEPGMPVMVTIDGEPYEVRFTLRVLKALQRDHGISILNGRAEAFMDPEKLALILYHGLMTKHPEITLDWVEDNVDSSMLIGMIPALTFAMSGQTPKAVSPNGAGPQAVALVGSTSGPLDGTTSA